MNYETVIGLEVHAQLLTESKIFCGCSNKFGALPNHHTCPVCLGMPGALPVLNQLAVDFALKAAIATSSQVPSYSIWERKHYFYPDLPAGYQISQLAFPLCRDGHINIYLESGSAKRIGINRIHMEEDAGKLVHDPLKPVSYVDYNRGGTPLIEIVSEPDLASAEEVVAYLKALRDILVYLEVCDGNMEEGSFRCDANVSLKPAGSAQLGTKTEIKNMNSFRNVQRAIEYEVRRQRSVLEGGAKIVQQTRLWDANSGKTVAMRSKEEAHDYRYFPNPDLLPLTIDQAWLEKVKADLPELPQARRERFQNQYGLSAYDAEVLTMERPLADYFEDVVKAGAKAKTAANWIMSELLGRLNAENMKIQHGKVQPDQLAELLAMMEQGELSGKMAKDIFSHMFAEGRSARQIKENLGLSQVSDNAALEDMLKQIFAENPSQVAEYQAGKEKLLGFFVGQAMKLSKGQANPAVLNQLAQEMLKK